MGTRNLTAVYYNGEVKVAQYGQWDGYPSGQGNTILEFLNNKFKKDEFIKNLKLCYFGTDEEMDKKYLEEYPQFSRNTAADILAMIQDNSAGLMLCNSIDFAKYSLFCEYAYVIDLDTNEFEFYKGFNKSPVPVGERFSKLEKASDSEYYPIGLVWKWSLDNLPTVDEMQKLIS